ncbi:transcriptional repressor TraM (plasmid) [Bradyrhizobium sp. ISRA443]|uniref:transcriptional repressor TraM n=1 Tax=unclassified Bradyrhizobium TaxID=2631580 RepID=UPI0024788CFC|nr:MULTISPECIES: transcriptional repressor TraM [unclassified Bradyrhizobium]WGR90726.1 transcriptional repressor TraM [Bradyrhizobium sp. ISRA435]WGS03143.1 transcriptional repressor TraM [Bradyrhizobium sp. ISRA436]WGS10063.1 transcriptional repressor TraM [Bradyrhizobium sp. ISRA437]WGS16948.1 transcriptional repressor TraM [Bradyrhizobium sp. ISRA443]
MRIVASNDDDESPGAGLNSDLEHIFGGIAQSELERLTIDAIREYRASVALAEAARLQRVAAEADTDSCPERRAELQRIHENAETEHRARQLVLNNLIDRLGYVPKVPAG